MPSPGSVLEISRLFCVRGKNVFVTGGAKGIGRMLTEGFVCNGAHVWISGRSAEDCESTALDLSSRGYSGTCHALPGSHAKWKGIQELVERLNDSILAVEEGREGGGEDTGGSDRCSRRDGSNRDSRSRSRSSDRHSDDTSDQERPSARLHVLVNNAGTAWGSPLTRFPESGWDRVMNLNVKGLFQTTRCCLPLLDAAAEPGDPARIINIGSVVGERHQGIPTYPYDASKAAVHMLTRKLAMDLANRDEEEAEGKGDGKEGGGRGAGRRSICVNAIAPGFVETRMTAGMSDNYLVSLFLSKEGEGESLSWVKNTMVRIVLEDGEVILYLPRGILLSHLLF